MSDNTLHAKSSQFSVDLVHLCRAAKQRKTEAILINQLLRSGTSIGANIAEANYAQSARDFVAKLEIALKECNESDYWLELIHNIQGITDDEYLRFHSNCIELRRMLVASVKTVKSREPYLSQRDWSF